MIPAAAAGALAGIKVVDRGGCGAESLRMVFKTPGQVMFTLGEGHVFSSAGVFGGYPGNSGYRHNVHRLYQPKTATFDLIVIPPCLVRRSWRPTMERSAAGS